MPAPILALASMASVQLGAALSTHLFDTVGPAGSAWLRVTIAALILLVATKTFRLPRAALGPIALLGTVSGVMTISFIEAVDRLPLGTVVAIEFLGPLGVAAVRAQRRSALVWPALALAGVLALTSPWSGEADLGGLAYAGLAAAGWAAYVVLTQQVGSAVEGLRGLAGSLTVAALVTAPVAAGPAVGGLSWPVLAQAVGLAVLVPLLPWALELVALRRMTLTAFGTLMALEPAFGTAIGSLLLSQAPSPLQAGGVVLVVAAGIGAQRSARTAPASSDNEDVGRSQTKPRQTYADA